jgi:hypothetical protein
MILLGKKDRQKQKYKLQDLLNKKMFGKFGNITVSG